MYLVSLSNHLIWKNEKIIYYGVIGHWFNVNLENIDKGNLKDIVKTLFDFISIKTSTKNSIGSIRNKLLFDYGILDDEMAEIAKW